MLDYLKTFLASKQKGQGLVEYGVLLVLIAIVAFFVVNNLKGQISNLFNNIVATF